MMFSFQRTSTFVQILLISSLLASINCTSSQSGWNNELVSNYQKRFMFPSYFQDFLGLLQTHAEQGTVRGFFDGLTKGVKNNQCRGHVAEWLLRFVSQEESWTTEENKWAAHLIDSWGKVPEGILTGHVSSLGDFYECIGTVAKDIKILNGGFPNISRNFGGNYCSSYILDYATAVAIAEMGDRSKLDMDISSRISSLSLSDGISGKEAVSVTEFLETLFTQDLRSSFGNMRPSVAVCMPDSCSVQDVHIILMNAVSAVYSLLEGANGNINATLLPWPVTLSCYDGKKPDPDAAVIVVLVLLSILFLLCLGTGVVDYFLNHGVEKPPERGLLYKYLMTFSFYTNTKKWMSTRKSTDDLGCLHGMRYFSMTWVVLGHSYILFMIGPQWNVLDVKYMWKNWTMLAVINGTFAVDTFFVMSGLLASYNIFKLLDKTNGKINIPMFYIHRIFRLTPTYAILVAIVATLTVYAGNGPTWTAISGLQQNCRNHWWANLLYINNIYKTDEPCNGESWYLANDMQFYLLSPFIVYPIWKWRRIGLAALAVLTCLSIASPVLISNFYPAPPAEVANRPDVMENRNQIYRRPWARIVTFLVGIWLGWILHATKGKKLRLPWWAVTVGWIASTCTALAVVFGIAPWFNPDKEIPKAAGLFYAGLSRFSFGVAVSWVIFACVKGYGGIVNEFLSWKVFMPLGRLSFCMYLLSMQLQIIYHIRLTIPIRYDTYSIVNVYFSHLVMASLAGFVATMAFESPFIALQRLIFERK